MRLDCGRRSSLSSAIEAVLSQRSLPEFLPWWMLYYTYKLPSPDSDPLFLALPPPSGGDLSLFSSLSRRRGPDLGFASRFLDVTERLVDGEGGDSTSDRPFFCVSFFMADFYIRQADGRKTCALCLKEG